MTPDAARALVDSLPADCEPDYEERATELIAQALSAAYAQGRRAGLEDGAKIAEKLYDESSDREAVFYECCLTIAEQCRQQAAGGA